MEGLLHLFTWYPLFAVPAGMGWAAVYVSGGRNFDLQTGDKALLIAPWLALNLASWLWPGDKSLANLVEVTVLAIVVPVAMLLRVVVGRRTADQARFAMRLAAGVSLLAVLLWLLVPVVPMGWPRI
ncbi:MAG: hypothetical protein R3298_04465 [Gammaproteobacteria bacterium]|nr:hypothetical protein [Gammaproteobacteria bacterium]